MVAPSDITALLKSLRNVSLESITVQGGFLLPDMTALISGLILGTNNITINGCTCTCTAALLKEVDEKVHRVKSLHIARS